MSREIQVILADDHPVVLEGLQKMLAEYRHIQVIDTCCNGNDLLQSLKKKQPNVVVLDIQMPGRNGDELAKLIDEMYPAISILALTNLDQSFHLKNMLLQGALGYILKSASPSVLVKGIETVYQGKQFIDPAMKAIMQNENVKIRTNRPPALTSREKEILELIANENTSPEIAAKLNISQRTVENHRINILLKLDVKNTAGLVRKAIQLGIIQ